MSSVNDFVIEEDGSLIEYNGNDSDVIVPDGVTVIYRSAFWKNKNLKSIKIPNSVKDIDESAFENCINLTNVTLPDGLKVINVDVFKNCESLKSIIIPNGVTRIGVSAFEGCSSLSSISFPNSLKKISSDAFESCAFTDVTLPDGLVVIGSGAFKWCIELKNISIPSSVEVIEFCAFERCKSLDNIEFPDSVKKFGSDESEYCKSLNYTVFPDSVKEIGREAFFGCDLSTVVLSASTSAYSNSFSCINVYRIGRGPLRDCSGDVIITPDLFVIENGVLHGYLGRDEEVFIPDGVKVIKENAFSDDRDKKNIKSIKIPNSVKVIEDRAFEDCYSLRNLYIPASVEKIGKTICKMNDNMSRLINIEVDENNKYYSSLDGNLYNKDKTKLLQYAVGKKDSTFIIPDGVVSVEESVFESNESLNTVKIPNSVVCIKEDAFRFCYGLSEILIPDSVKEIGYEAFCACYSLKTVKIGSGLQKTDGAFYDCPYVENICIKDVAQYCNIKFGQNIGDFDNDGYKLYLNGNLVTELIIPEGVTVIPSLAFYKCNSIENVVLPKSLSKIEKGAFGIRRPFNSSHIDVYYRGTEEEWSKVDNESLEDAKMHFNFKQEESADVHTDKPTSLSSNNDVLFEVSDLMGKSKSDREILDILKGKNISVKDILDATAKVLYKNSEMIKSFCDSKIVPKIDELLQKDYSVGECLNRLYKIYPRVLVNRAMCDRLYNEDIKL